MARIKEATRPLRQQERVKGSHRTGAIVADYPTLRIVLQTAAFALLLLAVPTVMAITKQFGWW